jgi:hypothetical protein
MIDTVKKRAISSVIYLRQNPSVSICEIFYEYTKLTGMHRIESNGRLFSAGYETSGFIKR